MAEAILSDISVGLISKVGSLMVNGIGLWYGVKDELDKLKRTVSTIEAVLLHAEELSMENLQVKHWLGLLSEAMYDADDLLDEFSTEALRQQVMDGSGFSKKVRLFFSSSNQFASNLKMSRKVKALRERLDEIASNRRFHLEERSYVQRRFVSNGRNQTHSSPPEVVIGRESDKEAIVEILLSPDYEENVSFVAIVGFGGLGKTTLAQSVYNDDRVKNHFELKMWVCVSDDFDVQMLVKNVLESACGQVPTSNQMDVLKNGLYEKINGRRYLLVLDDVWNEDVNKWSSFKDLLTSGARGSKVVITTRSRIVAKMSRPISVHELRGLSEIESWSLFEQVAFEQKQLPSPSLQALGKEIVAKCCGVPLAIKTIGGVLYFKDPLEWVSFKDNELSKIDVFKQDILPILRLSYNHLPCHYKHCFAYCSLYPKDYKIRVHKLIQLWNAQGYIRSTNPNECLGDAGFQYFMDLYRFSFFQDLKKDEFGNIMYCKMHDLVHDLAVSVAEDNFSATHSGMTGIKNNTQDVSSLLEVKKTRTILKFNIGFKTQKQEIDAIFCNLTRLRVLNLSSMDIRILPDSIDKLKHLRYLDLFQNYHIRELPNSITNLYNLQVINLELCGSLIRLPSNVTKLVNLTDIGNRCCTSLSHMPQGIGKLTRLEKLSEFVISRDESISKHSGGLEELHSLNNLRGELEIRNLRYVKNPASEFRRAHLSLKQKLQKLRLFWGSEEDENDTDNDEMGMEALCPHPNLKALQVYFYGGVKTPSWLPSLINLVSIGFWNCKSIQWMPPFDQLRHLKTLSVSGLTKLEHIAVENQGGSSLFFPSLTNLTLQHCPNLKGFQRLSTEELPCIPCLSELCIDDCLKLTYLPLFPELKILTLDGDGMKSLMAILKMRKNSATQSPFSTLSKLQYLEISDMEEPLENEFLQSVPSLKDIELERCSDEMLQSFPSLGHLKALSCIEFKFMKNLDSLPKGLQYVTSLQRLTICGCPGVMHVPEWMSKLNALQHLRIINTPQLEERCKNNTAEDWPYISHIPNIEIGRKQIQRNGCYLLL